MIAFSTWLLTVFVRFTVWSIVTVRKKRKDERVATAGND